MGAKALGAGLFQFFLLRGGCGFHSPRGLCPLLFCCVVVVVLSGCSVSISLSPYFGIVYVCGE